MSNEMGWCEEDERCRCPHDDKFGNPSDPRANVSFIISYEFEMPVPILDSDFKPEGSPFNYD